MSLLKMLLHHCHPQRLKIGRKPGEITVFLRDDWNVLKARRRPLWPDGAMCCRHADLLALLKGNSSVVVLQRFM